MRQFSSISQKYFASIDKIVQILRDINKSNKSNNSKMCDKIQELIKIAPPSFSIVDWSKLAKRLNEMVFILMDDKKE